MPPKRVAMAQSIRDAYTEETSCAEIERWSGPILSSLEGTAKAARSMRQEILKQTYTADAAAKSETSIITALRQYQEVGHDIYLSAETIRTVIACRIPELKEEDNLGVGVQTAVLKMIDGLQDKLAGGGSGDKGGSSGVINMFSTRDYLSARGGIEDKLLGKPADGDKKEGEKKEGTKAPSVVLELQQLDADILLKLELSATQISTVVRSLINAYALNWKKLIQPRNSIGDKMVS